MIKTYRKNKTIRHPGQADVQLRRLDFGWLGQAFLKRKVMLASIIVLIITLPIFLFVMNHQKRVDAAWMNDSWSFRKAIPITYTGSQNLTEYQILINSFDTASLISAGKMQSNCADIRFTNYSGKLLNYSIVGNTCNTSTTQIWVKTDSIPASNVTIYMYYGNPSAPAYQSESNTFSYSSEKTVGYVLQSTVDQLEVVSMEDGNTITHNGATRTLNKYQKSTFNPVSQFGPVTAKKLFNADDASADTDMLVPVSWAGTEFMYFDRTASSTVRIEAVSPWGTATANIYINGTLICSNQTITSAGATINCAGMSSGTVRITSDIPILVFSSDITGVADQMPIHPSSTGKWFGSALNTLVFANASGADYRYLKSSDVSETNPSDLGANAYANPSIGGAYGSTPGGYVYSTNNPIGVHQYGDSDGSDAHYWQLQNEMGTRFAAATGNTDYISIVSDQAATCTVYDSNNAVLGTGTATSTNTSVYFLGFNTGSTTTWTTSTWHMECNKKVSAYYQKANDTESGLWSYPSMRQFTYPTPVVGTPATEENGAAPVAYWKFDEGYGTNTQDSTPNANNGTLGGTTIPTWQTENQCVAGKCLFFDGTTSKVTGSAVAKNVQTVSFWIRPNIIASQGLINLDGGTHKLNTDASGVVSAVGFTSPIYYLNGKSISSLTLVQNQWNFVSVTTAVGFDTASSWTVGTDGTNFIKGFLDDVKIYNYARTAAQIKSDFIAKGSGSVKGLSVQMGTNAKNKDVLSNGLVTYWKSDEASGNGADSSGNSNTTTVSGSNNYGVGKYGNGLRSGVATTNLITNPSLEINTTGWDYPYGNGSLSTTNSTALFGSTAGQVTIATNYAWSRARVPNIPVSPNSTYIFSVWVKGSAGSIGKTVALDSIGDNSGESGGGSTVLDNTWKRISMSKTTNALDTTLTEAVYVSNDISGAIFYFDGAQLELASAATPYVDGSLGTGYTWSGIAHASTSTRTASTATNATLLNNTSGSLSFWFNSPSLDTSAQCPLGASSGDSTGGLFFGLKSTGVYLNHNYAVSQNVTPQYVATINNNTWYHVVYTWDNATLQGNLYVNGVLQQNVSYSQSITKGEYLQNLGTCTRSGYTTFNGTLDDIRDYNRTLSGAEVSKLYAFAPGPVGYWNLDEGTGGVANDSSGNGLNGVITNAAWNQGKFGKSLKFTNSGDKVVVTHNSILDFSSNSFTVSAWVKNTISQSSDYAGIVAKETNWGAYTGWWLGVHNNGTLSFQIDDATNQNATTIASANLNDGNWHFLTAIVDRTANTITLYKDSTKSTPATITAGDIDAGDNLEFGEFTGSSGRRTTGNIDDVRIYNYARTSGQIIEDMNAGHPLGGSPVGSQVGYWKFDEGYGITANNSGNDGSTINGTLTGSTTLPTWTNSGKFGKTVNFDGIDDYVTTTDAPSLDMGNMTISAWIKTGRSTEQYVSERAPYYFATGITSGKLCYWINSVAATWTCTTKTVTDNIWHHVVGTWDGTNKRLYIDGQLDTSVVGTGGSMGSSTLGLNIGARITAGTPTYFFSGLIDEVKIYSAALTADEVKLDYNRGSAMVLGTLSDTSGLTGGSVASSSAGSAYCIPGDTATCNAPVAEWKMEEKTGANAYDISGNGNTCILTNSPTWSTGKVGGATQFSSGTNYLDCGNNSSLTVGTNDFTVSTWLYPTAWVINKEYVYVMRSQDGSNDNGFDFELSTWGASADKYYLGAYRLQTTAPGYSYMGGSSFTIDKNTWSYVTVVRQGQTLTWYLNGVKYDTDTNAVTGTNFNTTNNFSIAKDRWSAQYQGKIDQFRLYTYARTPAQIAWDYNQGKPIGWWKMDECQGTVANDSSGNGNSGTITIGATVPQSSVGTCTAVDTATAWYNGRTGKYNSSLNFDGVDDLVRISNTSAINSSTVISISSWIKTSSASTPIIFSTWDGTNGFQLYLTSGKAAIWSNGGSTLNSNVTVNDGNWHNIVGTWNGTTGSIYVDGKFITSAARTGSASTKENQIGTQCSGANSTTCTQSFTGQIDDVRVYNYALTPQQVKMIYNGGAAVQFAPITGSP